MMRSNTRFLLRTFGLLLSLSFPLTARADLASDFKEPMRLLETRQFAKASAELDKIAPRYQDQFLLHYMQGVAKTGSVNEKSPQAQNIALLQSARASFRTAQTLAPNAEQKKEALDMVKGVEDLLGELGAPLEAPPAPEPAPQPQNKDAEIAALKQRLAELEGMSTQAAVIPKPQLPIAPPDIPGTLPKLTPLKPTPKTAKGRVVNRSGKPLAGVEVKVSGTTLAGERTSFYPKTNAQGIFQIPLPDGLYNTRAELKTDYNGQTFTFQLHPLDGDDDVPQDSRKGVVEDYVWRLSGLRAQKSEDPSKPWNYYGGEVKVDFEDLGHYGVINDKQGPRERAEFPDGFSLHLTFTPQGNLPDGLPGRAFLFIQSYKPAPGGLGPYLFPDFHFPDVPTGRYKVTAKIITPDGTTRDVPSVTRIYAPLQTPALSQVMDFEPDASSIRPVNIRLSVWPAAAN